ncbi:MAG: feruloyl-CoA synthase [Stellaceae bacterium]
MSAEPARKRGEALRFAKPEVAVEPLSGGGMVLRSRVPLGPIPRCIGTWLERWAAAAPERPFLVERDQAGAWRSLGYGAALAAARSIAQSLLQRPLGPERPIMILSENSIAHAVLMLGAMQVGIPVVPVSTAYSLRSRDFVTLRGIGDLVQPGIVFAEDGALYGKAIAALDLREAELVVARNPPRGVPASDFAALLSAEPGAEVDRAYRRVGPDTVAKILFTSGSTGDPKGVINTQRMMCSNQESYAAGWPFLDERPPVFLDWLPWSHTFAGNSNFNMVLRNGGTYYLDSGKPLPGLIEQTLANLREVSPTMYFGVPAGYAMLLDHLERDADLAERFLRELDLLFYAGAALPQSSWDRLEALCDRILGRRLPMLSGWGTTETAPMATLVQERIPRAGNVGIPGPGTEIKLVPNGDRLEIRVRGPNVTPGYWRRPDLTQALFDEEGFYRPGDAARLAAPEDPDRGLLFDGRIAENFKLSSGTWVNVGALRIALIAACDPLVADAVVTGHDRDEIGLIVFPSLAGCRSLCPDVPPEAPLDRLIGESAVREALGRGLARHNAQAGGSSRRVARALLVAEPPSIDRGEITDKGYINQRAVLRDRAELVAHLYASPPFPDIVLPIEIAAEA